MFRPPPGLFINAQAENKQAYAIACVALKAFTIDCVNLVSEAVKKTINNDLRSETRAIIDIAKKRKSMLKDWVATTDPLAFGPRDCENNNTLQVLIQILSTTRQEMQSGLPMSNPKSITYRQFGIALYSMGRSINSLSMAAPVNPKGGFPSILIVAVERLCTLTQSILLL